MGYQNSETEYKETASSIYRFYGLNKTRSGQRGEFESMRNMSASEYPLAAPRGSREVIVKTDEEISAVLAPDSTNTNSVDGITGIVGDGFYYNGILKSGEYKLSGYSWEIVRDGNLYIMNGYRYENGRHGGALYYYNIDTDKFSAVGTELTDLLLTSGTDRNGQYLMTCRYALEPEVINYSVTSEDGGVEYPNKAYTEKYESQYIRKNNNIFSAYFSVGDELSISGFLSKAENGGRIWSWSGSEPTPQSSFDASGNNTVDAELVSDPSSLNRWTITNAVVTGFATTAQGINGTTVYTHKIYFELTNNDGNSVSFDDMGNGKTRYCPGVTLAVKRPVFDHICTHHNRIWGTSASGNNVYASSSDTLAFAAADIASAKAARLPLDTPGRFTGICEYGSDVIAFKEESISVISGSDSSSYYSRTINGIGAVCGASICVIPSGVIFLGCKGFYIYSGNVPECISSKLNTEYASAISGYDGESYYACAEKRNGERELLKYNIRYGVWHTEDDIDLVGMFSYRGAFYICTHDTLYKTDSGDEEVEWSVTAVRAFDNTLDDKCINHIWLRAELSEGAEFSVYTAADDDEFILHTKNSGKGIKKFHAAVRIRMSDSYRWRIEGKGRVILYEMELTKETVGRMHKRVPNTSYAREGADY